MFWTVGRGIGIIALGVAVVAALVLVIPRLRVGVRQRAATSERRARRAAAAGGLLAWALAPFWAVPTGIDRYDGYENPTFAYIAQEAYERAWMHHDNPIMRLAFPAARVRRVWRDPGHCPPGEPGGREPYADWRAEVRYYTYFGIPGSLLRVSCGGWAW
jgi:hypothetical protein